MSLAVVRDLRESRVPAGPEELAAFETDVLAGFVLARASAGLADGTISSDIGHLEQVRTSGGAQIRREPAVSACCGCSAVCGLPVASGNKRSSDR